MSKNGRVKFKAKTDDALNRFIEKYPAAFFPDGSKDTKPLMVGIFTLLTGQNRDIGRGVIAETLRRYTMKDQYQRAVATSAHRYGLSGEICGEVSDANRAYAVNLLASRQAQKIDKAA